MTIIESQVTDTPIISVQADKRNKLHRHLAHKVSTTCIDNSKKIKKHCSMASTKINNSNY